MLALLNAQSCFTSLRLCWIPAGFFISRRTWSNTHRIKWWSSCCSSQRRVCHPFPSTRHHIRREMKVKFYAVKVGKQTGVFGTWDECKAHVAGVSGAKYKSFPTRAEADAWLAGTEATSPVKPTSASDDKGKKRMMAPDVDDETGWDVVFSDGACKGNGQPGCVAGVGVWWGEGDPRNIAERCPGDQTNNRAELIAILRVLETTPQSKKPLLIKSDSTYSIKCFSEWLPQVEPQRFQDCLRRARQECAPH
ncbi:Ribonuclease H [Mycena sanguinolenta]|uniref:ribonuclease H n=1 Tax=Mycena sanguinolenta TaxID=230812 RepID=A0A8H6XBH7_9AGAR|nr:Ribonuclease H [Mycena sanguinolenta]